MLAEDQDTGDVEEVSEEDVDDLLVEEVELKARAAAIKPTQMKPERGYAKLYAQEILGADDGCDFAFLRPAVAAG